MSPYKVEPITCPLELGKGLHWDACTETLYCVDMHKGTVHSYKPSTCQFSTAIIGHGKSAMALIVPVTGEKNTFLVSVNKDVAIISWDGIGGKTSLPNVIGSTEEQPTSCSQINNGKVDPCGRLWAGTSSQRLSSTELKFEEEAAALYSFEQSGSATRNLDKVTMANGLEWSEDGRKFYFIDSFKYNVVAYDYDMTSNSISNAKQIFSSKENGINGFLAAMTIDIAGHLYIANYMGGQVIVIDSKTGRLMRKIAIPAEEVTSCTFGGPNLDILYVTTGNTRANTRQPLAGRIFQVIGLGATGYAGRSVILNDLKVEHLTDIHLKMGRCLTWNHEEQALFWVDSVMASIYSYKPSTKKIHSAAIAKADQSGFLLPIAGKKLSFLVGYNCSSIAKITWNKPSSTTSEAEVLTTLQSEEKEKKITCGKVDKHGQVWIGTASKYATIRNINNASSTGNVYQVNKGRELTKQLEKVGFPSDFEWSVDGRVLYVIDSSKKFVEAFDLNHRTGLVASYSSRQVFNLLASKTFGLMSSLTIDKCGILYIAVYLAGQVIAVNPENGQVVNRIYIPEAEVTSCAFGGINLDTLYVITCKPGLQTSSGKLFQVVNLGCQGFASREALLETSVRVEYLCNGPAQPRGMRWNAMSKTLQCADSGKGTVLSYSPFTKNLQSTRILKDDELTGVIVPVAGQTDLYVISVGMDFVIARWNGLSSEISSPVVLANLSNYETFKSGKNWICCANVDCRGGLWAGTTEKLPQKLEDGSDLYSGHLYSLQKGMQVIDRIMDVTLPCSFEWSEDGRQFFFVDTLKFAIEVSDYNEDTRALTNTRDLFRLMDHKMPGYLGGMTLDTNGMLYVANYFGSQILVVNSETGRLTRTIKMPCSEVISCAFGGTDMKTLFVATGASEAAKQTGNMFQVINLGVRGCPPRSIIMENSLRTEPVTPPLVYGNQCFWDEDEQLLYFTDPSRGTFHSYDPSRDEFVSAKVKGGKSKASMMIPLAGNKNKFLMALDNELWVVKWNGKSPKTSAPEKSIYIDKRLGSRFNTGRVDSRGRLWAGAVSIESSDSQLQIGNGNLYCIDRLKIEEKFKSVKQVSGLEWSKDCKRLFLIDALKSRVESYDYDVKTSTLSGGKVIYKLGDQKPGHLYSMTIDCNDTLYICNNHGCQILMIDSLSGKLLRTLSVPALEVLSCAFGGPNLDILFVTTGNQNPSSEFPNSGRLFSITNLGVRGLPMRKFIIDCSIKVEPVTGSYTCTNSPYWNAEKGLLYFVGRRRLSNVVCSYSPKTSKSYAAFIGNGNYSPTMIITVKNQTDSFVVSIGNQLAIITWDGVSKRTSEPKFITNFDLKQNSKKLSVGKVDPQGRLWSGTITSSKTLCGEERSLDEFERTISQKGSLTNQCEPIIFSNGLEWSLDSTKFFYVDSAKFEVNSFDFDAPSGIVSNKKLLFRLKDHNLPGSVDAMCIDTDGNLYIANYMGSQILVVDSESGALLSSIAIPAAEVTACAFGGPNMDVLYVTTSNMDSTFDHPHAGKLFQVKNLGVFGLPGRSVTL